MRYYAGKGTKFKKDECKEYKTIEGALKAAAKDETLIIWDETGQVIGSMTDNVPEGALKINPNGSVNVDDAGHTNPPERENGQNGADTEPQGEEQEVIVLRGKTKVTVVCDGALNLRRSAEWGNGNICGRAVRGQSYYVKAIHMVAGKKMVQTVDDIFLSGQSEHVKFERI